jgi:hypothetical protein
VSIEATSRALHLAPVPAGGQPSTASKFVLVGLANHAEPGRSRQSCYAVGLHPCQFIWPSLYASLSACPVSQVRSWMAIM